MPYDMRKNTALAACKAHQMRTEAALGLAHAAAGALKQLHKKLPYRQGHIDDSALGKGLPPAS